VLHKRPWGHGNQTPDMLWDQVCKREFASCCWQKMRRDLSWESNNRSAVSCASKGFAFCWWQSGQKLQIILAIEIKYTRTKKEKRKKCDY